MLSARSIGIAYTMFLRPELAAQTYPAIMAYWHLAFKLFIGDQVKGFSNSAPEKTILQALSSQEIDLNFFPFDSGVSLVRNALIKKMAAENIKYCIVTADSIAFTKETTAKIETAVAFLEAHPDAGILGFDLKDRTAWEWFMDIKNHRFILTKTPDVMVDEATGLRVKPCDICRQFFLARVDAILKVQWDEQFKTGEHEDFFWRFKSSGYKVYWTPDISGQYIHSRPPEYERYRNRQYSEYMRLLFKKYNLLEWVEYVR